MSDSEYSPPALLGCPHCGDQPEYTVLGSHIEIWCCAGMIRQKSDYLTLEERQTWNNDKLMHSDNAERKAFEAVAAEWNRRQPNARLDRQEEAR